MEARLSFIWHPVKRIHPILLACAALAVLAPSASAATKHHGPKGVQHLHFRFGPVRITPGHRWILP